MFQPDVVVSIVSNASVPPPIFCILELRSWIERLRTLAARSASPDEREIIAARLLGDFERLRNPFEPMEGGDGDPSIFDAVIFNGELELLAHRIENLSSVTTKTLLVEADRTFAGEHKPYTLTEKEIKRRGWQDRMIVHRFEMPDWLEDPRIAAILQRNSLSQLVARVARETDIVLLCDIDEIPRTSALQDLPSGPLALGMRQTKFFSNHERLDSASGNHFGAALVRCLDLRTHTPAEIRINASFPPHFHFETRLNAGVHLQYVAPGVGLENHLRALGHAEPAIEALLRDRERVKAGDPLSGYVSLAPDRPFLGGLAPVDPDRLAAAFEYVIATRDLKAGRRRNTVPDYLMTP